ncbi:hypothetical protein ASD16_15285 [Cellulomonas sp. Root485]|uniref:hypothetical protein n=1 Tax=Cellulomonas sp. Root485 TaxID=1736546 RepID=UPI0006F990AE|nr:hypothetical protein [Cellulomonas sp. Root485]KQY22012.1 hypothetical protein ASD16_15285 [Cellulomonas sp. Root485]
MFGSRTTLADPLPEHDDDWSADRLATFQRRLTDATADPAPDGLTALLDQVPHTPRNLASLIEHLVEEHARRARSEGRARQVVTAPLPDGAVPGVGHILVVRWLTRRHATGRRVIRRVSYAPAITPPSERTGRLVLRHLADQLTPA